MMISVISDDNARQSVTGMGSGRFSDKTLPIYRCIRVLSDGLVGLNQPPLLRTNLLPAAVRR